MPPDRIPDDELLDELLLLAEGLGRSPASSEMYDLGKYSHQTYIRRFGSWNEALAAAGLEPNSRGGHQTSEADLLDALETLADHLGKVPSRAEMDNQGRYSSGTYVNRFGSWDAAIMRVLQRADSE